jgi:hypothetical protein
MVVLDLTGTIMNGGIIVLIGLTGYA